MTESHPDREITLALRLQNTPGCPDGLSALDCLNCRNPLDMHQPDGELPERMLATCPACRAWHLIDCGPDIGPDTFIVLLPDWSSLRGALNPGEPAVTSAASGGKAAPR